MHETDKTAKLLDYIFLILLGIILGTPYALTKIALTTIPPIMMVAARVSLAAVVLWIFVFALRRNWPKQKDLMVRLLVQACLACILPYILLAFGQRSVDSALAAILNSTTPLFVCLISLLWTRNEVWTLGRLFGVFIGLVGVVMIAGLDALPGMGRSAFGQTTIILATVASAASVIHGRRFVDVAPEITAAGTLTFAAIILVPISFVVETPLRSAPSSASMIALLVNAIVATGFGSVIYFRLIRTIGSMGTASTSYLKPAVGVLIGCTFMGEPLTWTAVIGLIAILLGVVAINQRQSTSADPRFPPKLAMRATQVS
jgi:drug/metabolite transporter (DMT)-like permease